eukprot:s100_g31.t1
MSGGMGFAFLGQPMQSVGHGESFLKVASLLLAIVQVQFGYSLITRQLYMQRRRWVMELHRDEAGAERRAETGDVELRW